MSRESKRLGLLLLLPMIVFSFIFGMYPLIFSIFLSFTPRVFGPPEYWFAGPANYFTAVADDFFRNSLSVTFIIGFGAVCLELLLGLALALLLNEKLRGARFARIALLLPMMTPPIVVGIIWKTMLLPTTGPFAFVFRSFGMDWPNILGTPMSILAVILTDVWQNTPFVMLILLAGLQNIPPPIVEAADLDGARSYARFRHVTLPLLFPVMLVAIIFRLVSALKIFDTVYVLTQGGPSFASEVISIFVQRTFVFQYEIAYASAASIIFMIMTFALAIAMIRVMRWSQR